MDIIDLAREIGKKIQEDERYIKLQIAQKKCDENENLQNLIGEFNLKRFAINNEVSKEDRNEEEIQKLNLELRELYSELMADEDMITYNNMKKELDQVINRVTAIIVQSSQGVDPSVADYEEESCGGSCSSCSGCH